MIPVYRNPHDDEHIYGWLANLAFLNGMDVRQFMNTYAGGQKWEGAPDSVSGIVYLESRPDTMKLIYRNTLFPAIAPFMSEVQQASVLNHLLYGGQGHIYHTVTKMKVCPDCMAQDAEKGILPYYRVWHQLGEVHTCAVHGTRLLILVKTGPLEDKSIIKSAVTDEGSEDDFISKQILNLYRNPVDTSLEKWRYRLPKRMRRLGREALIRNSREEWFRESKHQKIIERIPCAVCGRTFIGHTYMVGRYNVCPSCRIRLGKDGTERQILSLRKDYRIEHGIVIHSVCGQELRKRLSPSVFIWTGVECSCLKKSGSLDIHKKKFDDTDFTVIGYERNNKGSRVVRIRHNVCEHDFTVKPNYFKERRFCRVCALDAYRFKRVVKAMTGEEYEILNSPSSLGGIDSTVSFRHRTCGTEFSNRAKNFLEGQRCPFCSPRLGAENVINLLNGTCDLNGYALEADGMYIRITFPDGRVERMRCVKALQEITRLDRPKVFPRLRRIDPPINCKAKVYLYYKEHHDINGIFNTNEGPEVTGVSKTAYYSSLAYLCNQKRIIRVKKGVYRIE